MLESTEIRDNFQYYFDFYISAKERSFTDASKKYFTTPSNLSRSVAKLEDLLSLKLANTTNKGLELTIDGERLLKKLDEFFMTIQSFDLKNLSSNIDVVLTIGTTRNIADFLLGKYLNEFYEKYPNVKINIITDSASNLNEYLINHKIDVLIDYLTNINSSEKYELEIKTIAHFKTCFACSKKYYSEINDKIHNLKDLKDYKLVIPGSSRRRQFLDEVLHINNIELNPIYQMPDSKLMADVVKDNDFIGYFIEDEIVEYDLTKIELKEEIPSNPIAIIYPKNTINSVAYNFVQIVLSKEN